MERNKCETAIHCLEIALHPNTDDKEVIAAVNGFRRTADGTPLSDICRAIAATEGEGRTRDTDGAKWRAKLDRLNRENIQLRLTLETQQRDAAHRLREAEQRVSDLTDEMMAARFRASEADTRLTDLQVAYRALLDRASQRTAPPTTSAIPEHPSKMPLSPFQAVLAAVRQRGDEPASAYPAAAPNRRKTEAARAPWTA